METKQSIKITTYDPAARVIGWNLIELFTDGSFDILELDQKDMSQYGDYRWFHIGELSKRFIKDDNIDLQIFEKSSFGNFGTGMMTPVIDLKSVIRVLQSNKIDTYGINVQTWKSMIANELGIKWFTNTTAGKDYKAKNKELAVNIANDLIRELTGKNFNIIYKSKASKFNEDNKAEAFLINYVLIKNWFDDRFDLIRNSMKQIGFVMDEDAWKERYG